MSKGTKEISIGNYIKEKSFKFKRRIGQVVSILEDSKSNPTLECILVHHKTLLPIENLFGHHKVFKIKRNNVKYYVPRHKLFEKKSFEIGGYISYQKRFSLKYGRIMCFLNE